jgi:hypothetical protein
MYFRGAEMKRDTLFDNDVILARVSDHQMLHYLLDKEALEKVTNLVTANEYEVEVDENQVEHDHPFVARLFRSLL